MFHRLTRSVSRRICRLANGLQECSSRLRRLYAGDTGDTRDLFVPRWIVNGDGRDTLETDFLAPLTLMFSSNSGLRICPAGLMFGHSRAEYECFPVRRNAFSV